MSDGREVNSGIADEPTQDYSTRLLTKYFVTSVWKDVGNRFAGFWYIGDVILAEECGERGSDLTLCDCGNFRPLAERLCIRAEKGHPNVFRIRNLGAMALPLVRGLASTVVRR